MNQLQTFVLVLALLICAVVLLVVGQTEAGMLALGAAIGAIAPTGLAARKGGND